VPRTGPFEQALCAIAILNIGSVDLDGEQPSICVGQDVALPARDLLACIVALASPFLIRRPMLWLSMMAPVGEALRPTRSRSAISKAW